MMPSNTATARSFFTIKKLPRVNKITVKNSQEKLMPRKSSCSMARYSSPNLNAVATVDQSKTAEIP